MISNTSSPQLAPKPITFVSCRGETQLGMFITEAVRVLLSSTSSRRTSIVDVKRVLTHFDFHLNAFLITLFPNVISQCKFCKNGFFFSTFFLLSHTCHFETRPSSLSKIGENAFGAHFLKFYRKNENGDPYFLFHDFNKDSASFRCEKKLAQIYVQFFGNLLNCTD